MNKLHVLFINDGNAYTAQCLQYDIAAQGKSIKDARKAFEYALISEIGYLALTERKLKDLPAAPQYYWKIFEEASVLAPIDSPPMRTHLDLSDPLMDYDRELRVA
jgi:hypothetical protein